MSTVTVVAFIAAGIIMLFSCSRGSDGNEHSNTDSTLSVSPSEQGKAIERLLDEYDKNGGSKRIAAADRIFALLYREEMTDNRLKATDNMPSDSMDMLVWYWSGEYLWTTQDYAEGLNYASKALPLTYNIGDAQLQSDCERLVGLFHFRMSSYDKATEHVSKSLEISRNADDKSRMGSSLNTLAGICLTAKQFDDGEKYILEAIRCCEETNDSNLMPIRYGMASEVYHAKGEDNKSLEYARKAYMLDSLMGNTDRSGIRLSQMAAAQMALKQDAAAEKSIKKAIPILEKAGNDFSLSICRNQMGELLIRRGARTEAEQYFRKAAEFFSIRKDMYNESRAQKGLYEALKNADPKEADIHLQRYASLKDSIYQHDMEQAISQYNVKYKTKELEHQQEQERLEKRVIIVGGIALIIILLCVIAGIIYAAKARHRSLLAMKKVSDMRENFFTNITHEFRTPLTLILGLSHDMQEDESPETREKALTIERQGKGLLALINQLLDISKIKSAVGNAEWRNGDLTAYLTMIVESYRNYAQSRDIKLQFFAKDTVEMDFVPDYIAKLMNNLLSNAFKFTPAMGTISVMTWRSGERLHIDVADTGEGMDKDTMNHIFEPFYQAESDSKNIGTGVGLALVKQIIDSIDGKISVESVIGKGTTFHIEIPIHNEIKIAFADNDSHLQEKPADKEPELVDTIAEDDVCRILIIEDNRDIAAYIGSHFTDRYAISYATNGNEGLEKASDLVPDLIITDLMMPGMDGLEVCRQVRANEIINHIPIIIITAKITEEERIKGIEAGADAYLSKPFNSEELRVRVENLLDGRRMLQQKFTNSVMETKEENTAEVEKEQDAEQKADMRFLTKVSDIIYMLLSRNKDIDVTILASNLCMSSRQLHRKMVALTGYTPTAYIQHIKIKKAKSLLDANPQMSFNEVADLSGFGAYSNFVRSFKNVMGVTPTEYRRRE